MVAKTASHWCYGGNCKELNNPGPHFYTTLHTLGDSAYIIGFQQVPAVGLGRGNTERPEVSKEVSVSGDYSSLIGLGASSYEVSGSSQGLSFQHLNSFSVGGG